MTTRIKICGITNISDAMAAIEAGADYIGLIFVPETPRVVSLENAQAIASTVKQRHPRINIVGVFQNQPQSDVIASYQACALDYIQLHGQESLEYIQTLPVPVIKTILLQPDINTTIQQIQAMAAEPRMHALLLDLPKGAQGTLLDTWHEALHAVLQDMFYFVAGKLTPENIQQVIKCIQPPAVDIASSVEQSPRQKCPQKMFDFCSKTTFPINHKEPLSSCNH